MIYIIHFFSLALILDNIYVRSIKVREKLVNKKSLTLEKLELFGVSNFSHNNFPEAKQVSEARIILRCGDRMFKSLDSSRYLNLLNKTNFLFHMQRHAKIL